MFFRINLDRSFYRFVTMHACDGQTADRRTDRQTDRQTEFSSLDRAAVQPVQPGRVPEKKGQDSQKVTKCQVVIFRLYAEKLHCTD